MPRVTIYSTNTCAYCHMVKQFLSKKGISFSEINLDEHPERQQEALSLSGSLTVPVTLIEREDDKQVIVGWNPSRLIPALS